MKPRKELPSWLIEALQNANVNTDDTLNTAPTGDPDLVPNQDRKIVPPTINTNTMAPNDIQATSTDANANSKFKSQDSQAGLWQSKYAISPYKPQIKMPKPKLKPKTKPEASPERKSLPQAPRRAPSATAMAKTNAS